MGLWAKVMGGRRGGASMLWKGKGKEKEVGRSEREFVIILF